MEIVLVGVSVAGGICVVLIRVRWRRRRQSVNQERRHGDGWLVVLGLTALWLVGWLFWV